MAQVTKTITVCDKCGEEIDDQKMFVNAMVYGATFHYNCWSEMSGKQLTSLLALDDITINIGGQVDRKACYEWGRE